MRQAALLLALQLAVPAAALDLCAAPELEKLKKAKIAFSKVAEDGSASIRREFVFAGCRGGGTDGDGYARWRYLPKEGDLVLEILFREHNYDFYLSRKASDPSWRWIHWSMAEVRRRDPRTGKLGDNVFFGGSLCFNNHLSLIEPSAAGCHIRFPFPPDHPGSPAYPGPYFDVHLRPHF
jgi:hypothetical protein